MPFTGQGYLYYNKNTSNRKGSQLHKKPAVQWKLKWGGRKRKRVEVMVKTNKQQNYDEDDCDPKGSFDLD